MKYFIGIISFIVLFSVSCASVPVIKDTSEPTSKITYRIYDNYDGNYDPRRIPKEWIPFEWSPCPSGQNHIHVNLIPSEYNQEPFDGSMSILIEILDENNVLIIAYGYVKNGINYIFGYDASLNKYKQIKPEAA